MTLLQPFAAALGCALALVGSSTAPTHLPALSHPSPAVRPDFWRPISMAGAPAPSVDHVAVWTGSRMIVWGGFSFGTRSNGGGLYYPEGDSWTPMSLAGAPSGRSGATAVWTGSEMLVWGGFTTGKENTGGRYDPATDSWSPLATPTFLEGRYRHSAVWTGSKMIAWGGHDDGERIYADGGAYDPATGLWSPLATFPGPLGRANHAAVWTGSEMLIWGGFDATETDSFHDVPTGWRYDPVRDSWSAMSSVHAPSATPNPRAVWTGSRLIVWSFFGPTPAASYDPTSDTWEPLPQPPALEWCPSTGLITGFQTVWTGSEMVVWGGGSARYSPSRSTWAPLRERGAPAWWCLGGQTAIWTGDRMIVWGPEGAIWTPGSP